MKKTEAKSKPQAMSLDDMTRELAAGLKDSIDEIDLECLKRDPEEAFVDLACRLIFRLRAKLTVVPVTDDSKRERERINYAEAAVRTFDALTHWALKNPGSSVRHQISPSGKFQVVVKTPKETRLFFGETVQDAYAQAAMTIGFDEAP